MRKNRLNTAYPAGLVLCIILFVFQAVYAAPNVVNKEKGLEKELKAKTQDASQKKEPVKEEKTKYVYNPIGKPDPFKSFLKKSGLGGRKATSLSGKDTEPQGEYLDSSKDPETVLEKIELTKLSLTAVIKGKNKNWAMVIDPKGRGHFLEEGTKVGTHSGVVDEIICEEQKTEFGAETVRKVVIKIPYRNRAREVIYRSVEMEMPNTRM